MLIGVRQLREEIGGPHEDPTAAGYISDDMLLGIINRYAEMLDARVIERIVNNDYAPVGMVTSLKEITVTSDYQSTGTASGKIGVQYFPWVFRLVDSSGDSYEYDHDLFDTSTVNNSIFERKRYGIHGRRIFVLPNSNETFRAAVGIQNEVVDYIAADLAAAARDKIIADAKAMMASRIQEGNRQLYTQTGDSGPEE